MTYKIMTYTIKKDELKDNILISKKFILEEEPRSTIFGTVSNSQGKVVQGCAVILQEYNKQENKTIDICIVYTNEEGYFGFSLILQENKNYRIIVYAPNNLI